MITEFSDWLKNHIIYRVGDFSKLDLLVFGINLVLFTFLCWLIWKISRYVFLVYVERLAKKTATYWDDALVHHRFFRKLAHVIPAFLIESSIPELFGKYPGWIEPLSRIADGFIVGVFMMVLVSFLSAFEEVLLRKPYLKDKPIASYTQLAKILVYIICGVLILSILLNKSPLYFFSAMGAMTAVVLLVFKDTILGFVASIQIAANDMLRVGDWVTMEKYGADGDVESINLTTVKIRNIDRTITTIPTYAFISDSFRNWRGMAESDGRRIKRAMNIQIKSIKFCDEELLKKLKRIGLLAPYLEERMAEITEENRAKGVQENPHLNGRNLTNLGVLRAYIQRYLLQHPQINSNMTLMVRQLPPSATGLPMEIYAFSKSKEWEVYEGIMADVFDHILAITPEFDLKLFESPTGDFSGLKA